jgi:predicted dehydrogenase
MTTAQLTQQPLQPDPTTDTGVAVVGCGYWGPNLIRNFFETTHCRVQAICDSSTAQLKKMSLRYPSVALTPDYDDLLADPAVEAVAIATPVETHFDLARRALLAGKHVLIEKPMTSSSAEAELLIDLAQQRGLVLMVDFTFIYTGAVRRIKQLIDTQELGRLYYYDSVRVNLGLIQRDVSVIWDLAVHDLSMMNYLIPQRPVSIAARTASHLPNGLADVAYITVGFEDDLLAHFHVNWLSPVKVRQVLVGGDRRMVLYDDIEPTEKVKVYDRGIHWAEADPSETRRAALVGYRLGDMWAPVLDQSEALHNECAHFIRCVRSGETPTTDGISGLTVVRQLEAAERSACHDGRMERI